MGNKTHTTETLRQTLFESIEGVIDGSLSERKAAQVANLAGQICKTADLEMKYNEHIRKADAIDGAPAPGPMVLGHQRLISGAE